MTKMRIISGVQPSGKLHLGNYQGAIRQFVDFQNKGEALFFIADWHALTSVRDGKELRRATLDVALDYLALGVDPEKSIIFRQSDVAEHTQLAWILSTLTPMGLLERAHSYKDKTSLGAPCDVGLFTYPVLMAADILLYAADLVPVGQDQKQHLEMARDIAQKFNAAYTPGYDLQDPLGEKHGVAGLLTLPSPHILDNSAVVPGLDGQKMSKSYANTLELFADEKTLKKKIMGIVTDSTPVEAPKPTGHPLLKLLLSLATAEEGRALTDSWAHGGTGYGTYKHNLFELFLRRFSRARTRRHELAQNLDHVNDVLRQGAQRARNIARPVWNRIIEAVGCGQRLQALS